MLLIDRTHQSRRRWQNLIDKDEDCLLRRQLDSLPDHVHKLPDGEIGRDQILLLIDSRDVRLLDLLADDLYFDDLVSACRVDIPYQIRAERLNLPEYDRRTFVGSARLRPCASRKGARL